MVRCFMFRAPIAGDAAGVGSVIIPCRPQGCTRGRCCAELHHSVVRLARMRWLTAYVAETEESWRERGNRKVGTAVREVARQCVMGLSGWLDACGRPLEIITKFRSSTSSIITCTRKIYFMTDVAIGSGGCVVCCLWLG